MKKNDRKSAALGFQVPRSNDELRGGYEVRVVYREKEGEKGPNDFVRVMRLYEAKELAASMGLDLYELNADANPPVMRIGELSSYIYEKKKSEKAKNKNRSELKEIQLSVNISKHDMEVKANKAREFIAKGDKVKVVLSMRRREVERREESKRSLLEFIVMMSDVAAPESMPRDEGSKSVVILKRKN